MGVEKRSKHRRKRDPAARRLSDSASTQNAMMAAFEKAGWQQPKANASPGSADARAPLRQPAPFRTKPTGKPSVKQQKKSKPTNLTQQVNHPPQPARRKPTKSERALANKILGSLPSPSTKKKDTYGEIKRQKTEQKSRLEGKKLQTIDFIRKKLFSLEEEDSRIASQLIASPKERALIAKRIEAGKQQEGSKGDRTRYVDVSLGIDFGTTSTKIVARQLYTDGEPAIAAPVPEFAQDEGNQNLWATRLWRSDRGLLTLTPEPNSALIPGLKTSLLDDPSPKDEAHAAAFLALMIAQSRGWVRERKEIIQRGTIRWSYNFGFPAASLDNDRLADCYRRVTAAALLLCDCEGFVDLSSALATLETVHAENTLDTFEAALQPEVAAAAAAVKGPNRIPHGLFVMIDVGGSTVDCCAFRLNDSAGSTQMPIMQATVELYGVLPSRICDLEKPMRDNLSYLLRLQLRQIIFRLHQENSRLSTAWAEGLPVFFVGGGARSAPHIREVEELSPWLSREWLAGKATPPYVFADLSLGDITHNSADTELHRLTVAAGLSHAADQIPQVQLPDSIEPSLLPSKRNWEASYIGPEQT